MGRGVLKVPIRGLQRVHMPFGGFYFAVPSKDQSAGEKGGK